MKGKERLLDKQNSNFKLEKLDKKITDSNELSKKKSLQEQGITLIALVVTIIILLILAGVTLNMALSDNGLFKQAQQVAQKSTEAMMREEVALLFTEWETDYYETGTKIEGRSGETMSGAFVEYDGETIIYEKDGRTYEMSINESGDIGEVSEVETDKSSQSYKARHPEDHIPVGFHHTVGTVSEGYVIEDDDKNEFVWIPVDGNRIKYEKRLGTINVSIKSTVTGHIEELTSVEEGIAGDKLGTFEGGGELATKLSSDEISSELKEANIINNAGGFWVGRYEAGINTEEARDKSVINDESESIGANEAFDSYWESHKTNIVVKSGMEPVRMISQVEALKIANSWNSSEDGDDTNVNFQSGLITGAEWDVMCEFVSWEKCDSLGLTCGNFWNVGGLPNYTGFHSENPASNWIQETQGRSKPVSEGSAGSNIYNKSKFWIYPTGGFMSTNGISSELKHIFDIGGNVAEMTTEIPESFSENCVLRGDCANGNTNAWSNITIRAGGMKNVSHYTATGFRIVLYVE